MRKRIYRISEDKFDDLKPDIEFEAEQIEETCFVNDAFSGTIFFKSNNDVRIRGVIYCDNPYVKIVDPLFDGVNVRIDYFVDDYNFKVSEALTGNFIIVAVGVEKTIPFSITYVKRPLICSIGEIRTLQEFADFAQNRFTEAVSLFYSDRFADFIAGFDKRTRLIYRGFKAAPLAAVNVDEFLVSCGLKTKMSFSINERQDRYYEVSENIRGEIEISRSTWGFIDIEVTCDADFVSVEKEHITGDFFLGSIFNMSYYIHKDKMHAGLNYAKISFDYRDMHKEITILATADKEGTTLESDKYFQNRKVLKAFRLYEDFRLRRVSTGDWCKQSLEIVTSFDEDSVNDNFLLLLKAFLYVTNNQKQEALWIIQDLKRTIEDKRSRDWAFLLYICTLIEREEEYVDRLTENIEGIFREHNDDPHIFWFLLFLRKEYIKNPTAKLRDIAKWVDEGWDSPLLYIEAYYIFVQDPYLITTLNDLTIKVLNWAKKKNAITREFAIQMMHVLETERNYNPKVLPILDACYQIYPDRQLLLDIVTYLLKAPFVEDGFLQWYRMAIEENLHVSGIFEAYMDALPSYSVDKLPQLLTMFFKYNSNLSYDKKALLYANIILHKDEDYDTYEKYESAIETFALEQLKLGRLDDNLAVCYQRLLELGIFDKEVARLISDLSSKQKIAVINPEIRRVFLYQEEYRVPTIANISDHKAYITSTGSEGVIFLEDNNGFLFVDDEAYLTEEVIHTEGYDQKLLELTPLNLSKALYRFTKTQNNVDYTAEDATAAEMILKSKQLSPDYLSQLYPKLIEVLRFNNQEAAIEQYFMDEADLKSLKADVIASVLEVFVTRSKYEEAYYMLKHTNASMLKDSVTTKLCQYLINQNPDKSDDFLINLTAGLVMKGIVHGDMVRYLIKYFVGPTETMLRIYDSAFDNGDDVVEFAERIITQALYRDIITEDILKVFDTYISRRNNKMIVEAFLTYEAHDYLSNQADIPETIFAYIYNRFKRGQSVNESMRIALLRYLCTATELDEDDLDMLDILLADAILRNQYFGFFSKCNERLKIKYHLYDKHFIEFNAKKRKALTINYSINGQEIASEDMIEMYDGLYVKQFILFYGDELRYEIYCDELSDEPLKAETFVLSEEIDDGQGRYALMNSIARHSLYGEAYELAEDVKRYQGLDSVTRDLFAIL
ncbi:DUF5717 family protein [Pseudobutyrivibrio xylanivorans]|uniref:DUF5717 domain-containing protein n=1 Tax=Pseudobutyrivibrio xylanivorans TaxID=185007 RepID=A0A5P6VSN1_PSEXY|nr:DUF5717 family protein [Pseudobutyrivibrio xylanivorans]QFJ55715.1 hypothetical protein FXF36_12910 [Pseudobutyrivibrio xylanivorans]